MTLPLHVIIGRGALGLAVLRQLADRDVNVRVASRSGKSAPSGMRTPEATEYTTLDATDSEAVAEATAGATVVYHCAQPAYARWPQEFPPLTSGILEGVERSGAKLIFGDNLYAYGRAPMPLEESHPNAPVGPNTRTRAAMADMLLAAHRDGRVPVAIARGSDFYGPFVTSSTMGSQVFGRALEGKSAMLFGKPDQPHTFTFIDDFAQAMVLLGRREEALGEVWHVPSGPTRTTREFIEMIFEQAGRDPKLTVAPGWAVRFLGWFVPFLRATSEVLYQSEKPWIVDSSKFEAAFGNIATPHEDAIQITLDWFRGQR